MQTGRQPAGDPAMLYSAVALCAFAAAGALLLVHRARRRQAISGMVGYLLQARSL
jgi:hypothetical protein